MLDHPTLDSLKALRLRMTPIQHLSNRLAFGNAFGHVVPG